MAAQRHKNAHHNGQYKNRGELIEKDGHFRQFSHLRKAKFIMAMARNCLQTPYIRVTRVTPSEMGVLFHFGKTTLTLLRRSRYTANTLKTAPNRYDLGREGAISSAG